MKTQNFYLKTFRFFCGENVNNLKRPVFVMLPFKVVPICDFPCMGTHSLQCLCANSKEPQQRSQNGIIFTQKSRVGKFFPLRTFPIIKEEHSILC